MHGLIKVASFYRTLRVNYYPVVVELKRGLRQTDVTAILPLLLKRLPLYTKVATSNISKYLLRMISSNIYFVTLSELDRFFQVYVMVGNIGRAAVTSPDKLRTLHHISGACSFKQSIRAFDSDLVRCVAAVALLPSKCQVQSQHIQAGLGDPDVARLIGVGQP